MRHLVLAGMLLCTTPLAPGVVVDITNVALIAEGPAFGVSSDGTYVAGAGITAYRWTGGVTQYLPAIPGGTSQSSEGRAVSDNGIVYGFATAADGLHAPARWVGTQLQVLPRPITGAASMAGPTTPDGQIAIITSYVGRSTRWTPTNNTVVRPVLGAPEDSVYAHAMTPDGQRIVGRASNQAALWVHPNAAPILLGTLPGSNLAFASATSTDASTLAGNSYFDHPNGGYRAFIWTPGGGMVQLGELPGGNPDSWAAGISGDGQIVAGYASTVGGPAAFLWTDSMGMVNLNELPGNLLAGTGWRLQTAWAISTDGSTVVGTAIHPSLGVRGYVATIGVVPGVSTLALLLPAALAAHRRRR